MRKQFQLPIEDSSYLELLGLKWETIQERGNWVIIYDYPIPDGYNIQKVNIVLKIESGYPISQIDMVYFYPNLVRKDNKMIGALANLQLDGKNWQRWSRHRTNANPWRSGIDNIETHLLLINYWLEREFKIR